MRILLWSLYSVIMIATIYLYGLVFGYETMVLLIVTLLLGVPIVYFFYKISFFEKSSD